MQEQRQTRAGANELRSARQERETVDEENMKLMTKVKVLSSELKTLQSQQREKDAFNYMTGIGADKKRAANMADLRSFTGFKLSPEFGEAKRREIARKKDMLRAQAMFSPEAFKYGPIAFPRVS